jgi:hypothetical protein
MVTWFDPKRDPAIRIPVSIVVQTAAEKGEVSHFLFSQNISMTGMYLESEKRLPADTIKLGESTTLIFYLPSARGEAIQVNSKIVRFEQIKGPKGQPVDAVAVEFLELDPQHREQLRLFISEYEIALENSISAEDEKEEEITDPKTVVQPLKDPKNNHELFQPLGIDDYKQLYQRVKEIEADLAAKKETPILPLQLLLIEVLEQMSNEERQLLDSLHRVTDPLVASLQDKTFLNLFFLRIKLLLEMRLLKALTQGPLDDYARQYLGNYYTSVCFEADQINEIANLVSQRLVSQENWQAFKQLNDNRAELDAVLQHLRSVLEPYAIFTVETEEEGEAKLPSLSLEECRKDVQEIIPDLEEEKDDFQNGANGDEMRRLWDTIFSLKDEPLKDQLVNGLAVRRKVRFSLLKCRALGEEIINHRTEITVRFRAEAKLIKECVTELMNAAKTYPQQSELIVLMIRLLEALSFEFGKLIRTIPRRLLTTEEIDSVRYRTSTFRKRRMPIVALQNFSKRYAVKMLFVVVLIYTSIYHVNILRKIHKRTIPLQLIDTLSVKQALMDSQGCLFVTIQDVRKFCGQCSF